MNFEPKEIMSLKRFFNSMKEQKFYQTRFFWGQELLFLAWKKVIEKWSHDYEKH
jgi:hypothetical protein